VLPVSRTGRVWQLQSGFALICDAASELGPNIIGRISLLRMAMARWGSIRAWQWLLLCLTEDSHSYKCIAGISAVIRPDEPRRCCATVENAVQGAD
jgi:hypothetical protein